MVEDNEDLKGLIRKLNDLPEIDDDDINYTDEEKQMVKDERVRL